MEDLEAHFSADPQSSKDSVLPSENLPQPGNEFEPDDLASVVTPDEVQQQLKRLPSQSSPGPDRIPYFVRKSSKCAPELLAMIYSACCLNQKIPSSWKGSDTILIYKKGDRAVPSNWRSISLQQTIYKIYAAVLSRRLASWALDHNKISRSQKGFLPFEGCTEHSFLLRSVLGDSKRRRKDVRIVWLDLKNAFGSVPHNT